MPASLTTPTPGGLLFTVRLTPRAGRSRMDGMAAGADGRPLVKLRVAAPPVDGAANAALIALVADALGVPKSAVTVVAGHGSRIKRIALSGDPDGLADRLRAWVEAAG